MPHAGARGSTATNGHESDDADDAFEDAEPPPTSSPANPYPSRSDFEAARRNLTRAVSPTPQPQPAAAASTQPGLEEQLAAAKTALAKARDESSTEPVVVVVGMLDGGCVCGGGGSLHRRCHRRARWIFPLASAVTIGVFVASQILNQGVVWLTVDAPDIRFLLPDGLHMQQAAMNATYWESVQDGWDAGATVSTVLNAGATGLLPVVCLLVLNICWFFQSPRVCGDRNLFSALIGVLLQCSKLASWFLMFSFIQSLAFQYSLAFDWNNLGDHNIEIKMDVAATSGAYAMTTAIFMYQLCANGIFFADRFLLYARGSGYVPGGGARRPLLACAWTQMTAGPNDGSSPGGGGGGQLCTVVRTVAAAVTQVIVAALVVVGPYLTW